MAQFLPEVKMDFIPSDDEEDTIMVSVADDVEENIIPDVKKKSEGMDVNDIFNMPENISPINAQGTEAATPNLTKKGKPRKKRPPMSEEHKAKLKLARDKALEVRRKNAAEKKELKDLQKEEKDLIKKNQIKKVNKLKKEIAVEEEEPPTPSAEPIKEPVKRESTSTITKKDLEDAQLEAIIKYETIRKQRKKEKQERLKHENEQKMVRETLMRAVAPQNNYKTNNPFGNCY